MKAILSVLVLVMGQMAMANDFAAVLGLRSNSADAVTNGVSVNSKTSFGLGVLGFMDFNQGLQFRSGFLYNQRNYQTSVGNAETDWNLAYVDIPVTLMYKFADYAGAFVGPVVSLLASKECKVSGATSCSFTKNPESLILPIQFGVNFKFAPQMGAELYYEMGTSEFWKDGLKNSRTVGANFLYTFE